MSGIALVRKYCSDNMLKKLWKCFVKCCFSTPKSAKSAEKEAPLSVKQILLQNAKEYCKSTTLHGLKYVANEKMALIERTFFAICIILVMSISAYYTCRLYIKWQTAPVFVSINPTPYFITEEPFPAVTVCNLNRVLNEKALEIQRGTMEHEMLQFFCRKPYSVDEPEVFLDWKNMEQFILNVSQSCKHMILGCRFGSFHYNCSEVFYPVITDEGHCCIFNMLDPKFMHADYIPFYLENITTSNHTPINWSAELGYPEELPDLFTPRRVLGPGESLGFSITLDVEIKKYYCSGGNGAGFKIALHSPNESPNIKETGVLISPGMETKLRISPVKTETQQSLRSMHRKNRRCLFNDEFKLKYFAHYTQRNCEMECLAEMLMQHCGCLTYYMPKIYMNVSVCTSKDTPCVQRLRYREELKVKLCINDCFPSCFDYAYFIDTFTIPISHNAFTIPNKIVNRLSDDYVGNNIAVVNMYFKENSFRSQVQTEFFTASDFLANVGGLLGFLLGASAITFIELYYFAIMRPFCAIFKHKTRSVGKKFFRKYSKQTVLKVQPKNSTKILIKRSKNLLPIYQIHNIANNLSTKYEHNQQFTKNQQYFKNNTPEGWIN